MPDFMPNRIDRNDQLARIRRPTRLKRGATLVLRYVGCSSRLNGNKPFPYKRDGSTQSIVFHSRGKFFGECCKRKPVLLQQQMERAPRGGRKPKDATSESHFGFTFRVGSQGDPAPRRQ